MDKSNIFKNSLISPNVEISASGFVINLIIASILSAILAWFYTRYGRALSNRKIFGYNFLLITLTTMFIITVVKSSLALSLGLVGALSVIRFRSAIKEPEELSYLFFAIAIGLGLGANQTIITVIAFFAVITIQFAYFRFSKIPLEESANMLLTVTSLKPNEDITDLILNLTHKYCTEVELNRIDDSDEISEYSLTVKFKNIDCLKELKKTMRSEQPSLKISILNPRGI